MSKLIKELSRQLKELDVSRAAILAISGPLREARDKHVNDARAIENEMNAKIKEVEKDLYYIDNDRATIARALGGRRMSDAVS